MPRRDDLHKILILGSGPIVIGQAAEFDYSGVQACKVLKDEGYEIVLVNSNPATIMTDPEFADATYVERLLPGPVAAVIERERPDALLPTLGGQTALNLAKALHEDGTLERFGVELIGANYDAIARAEDRDLFRQAMDAAGMKMPRSAMATSVDEAAAARPTVGLPRAARLAVGYALEEIPNDITKLTPASFEPAIDYVVVKWPRFAFEKFPGVTADLTTHMKSVGEAMAIGRTFQQAFAKALRSRELDSPSGFDELSLDAMLTALEHPASDRYDMLLEAFRRGAPVDDVHARTRIDPWFLRELRELALDPDAPFAGERSFKAVDTCAAEFEARTPYFYSGWERRAAHEIERGDRPSVVILGSGPNRIGQGIEFDYCCVHAAMTVRDAGRDAVMVNCNPETVSTDYDTSDRLYFEPLTLEDVLGVVEVERPEGVIVYSDDGLRDYLVRNARINGGGREIFLDRFLENAIEVDVDAICDGEDVWIGGIMQHVEEAGIHSGDSACVLPPHSLGGVMLGERLADMGLPEDPCGDHVSVKEAVLPFDRFAGTDALLGPEMRSTGEVMGVAPDFPAAFAKAQAAAGARLPQSGTVFLSVTDSDKAAIVGIAASLHDLGFRIVATRGTAASISRMGIPVERLNKVGEGSPHVVDWIENGDVDLVINTPTGTAARTDGYEIRRAAVARGIPCITTIAGGFAATRAIAAARAGDPAVVSLQELHARGNPAL